MKPAEITIVCVESGDWVGLFVNGELFCDGHSLTDRDWTDVIERFGCFDQNVDSFEISDEHIESLGASFPKNLSDVKIKGGGVI